MTTALSRYGCSAQRTSRLGKIAMTWRRIRPQEWRDRTIADAAAARAAEVIRSGAREAGVVAEIYGTLAPMAGRERTLRTCTCAAPIRAAIGTAAAAVQNAGVRDMGCRC